ncbi:MAG: hypothetical protein IKN04_07280 [Clostridia bacterium]|nr:hypothetical protein [Clostridia bacterium]
MSQRCPYCGAFLKENAAVCERCGKPITKAEKKKKSWLPFLLALADIGLLIWIIQSYLSS